MLEELLTKMLTILPTSHYEYRPDDVYNTDETGLFYLCFPNKKFFPKETHATEAIDN